MVHLHLVLSGAHHGRVRDQTGLVVLFFHNRLAEPIDGT